MSCISVFTTYSQRLRTVLSFLYNNNINMTHRHCSTSLPSLTGSWRSLWHTRRFAHKTQWTPHTAPSAPSSRHTRCLLSHTSPVSDPTSLSTSWSVSCSWSKVLKRWTSLFFLRNVKWLLTFKNETINAKNPLTLL